MTERRRGLDLTDPSVTPVVTSAMKANGQVWVWMKNTPTSEPPPMSTWWRGTEFDTSEIPAGQWEVRGTGVIVDDEDRNPRR